MGLDMYVHTTVEVPTSSADFAYDWKKLKYLYYWRGHHTLNEWMERLYRRKGGKAKEFNLVHLQLNADDIDQLEAEITKGRFPHRSQMPTYYDADQVEIDLDFVTKAREALAAGRTLIYCLSH
jgi:hypothetical protein